ERLILVEALAEPPGDLGAGELDAHIEGVAAVGFDMQVRVERERIARLAMSVAVVNMNAFSADLDAKVGVPHLAGNLGDFGGAVRKRAFGVNRREIAVDALR